jgi:putative ABC transport system permease protein
MRKSSLRVSLEVILDSCGNIGSLKARSALALIGVAIGTAAVIAMLHVGHNARIEALRQFEKMGTDLINILPGTREGEFSDLTVNDIQKISSLEFGINAVAAISRTSANIRVGNREIGASGLAVSDEFYSILGTELHKGRVTTHLDDSQAFVILGSGLAQQLENINGQPVELWSQITVDRQIFKVVGIFRPIIANMVLGIDLNNSLVVAINGARRLGAQPGFSSIAARLAPNVDDRHASLKIQEYLGAGTNIQTARQLISGVQEQMKIYSILLLAIGAVSLVVGGVGIMNVMLMNVVERRHEIGLRQALGARQGDIRLMFLIEALLLSSAGSIGGIVIGSVAAWIFTHFSNWQFSSSPFALPLGIAMACSVGLFFGSYPAIRAAKLDPVTALRSQ